MGNESESASSNLSHQRIDEHNQLWNDSTMVIPQRSKAQKQSRLRRKKGVNSRLIQLKSWSSLEENGNPYYQLSDYHGDAASNVSSTDLEDTLMLKTASEDTTEY